MSSAVARILMVLATTEQEAQVYKSSGQCLWEPESSSMAKKTTETTTMSADAAAIKSERAQLEESIKQIATSVASNPSANVRPLHVALSSDKVADLYLQKKVIAGEYPRISYIPTTSELTWVVFHFKPMLPPLSFRVAVDVGSGKVGAIEDPYISEGLA